MQTIKRTIIRLDEGETVTIETTNGHVTLDVKADVRGNEDVGTPMLVVSTTQEMLDDDSKEICFATIEPR